MEMNVNRNLIRKLRLENSWSQEQLAEEAGLSLRTVQRVESEGIASLQTRKAIARALNVSPAELDSLEPEEAPGSKRFFNRNKQSEIIHSFSPESLPAYYLLNSARMFLYGFVWLCLAANLFTAAILILGGIFFWELTPFTMLQSSGAGIISTLVFLAPIHLLFYWFYVHLKGTEVLRPFSEQVSDFSNN